MTKVLVSAGLPTCMEGLTYPIPFSDPANLLRIAQHAESLGHHAVWGNDHMTTQNYVRTEFSASPRFWEPLITYAWLTAATTTLRFGTGILVLPMRRDIVVTAKQIATLDNLSNGRLEIGVGVGAYREEFEALWPDSGVHKHLVSLHKSTLKDQAKLPMEDVNLIGSVDQAVERATQLKEAGVTHFLGLYFAANDVTELLDQMQLFAEEVMPRIVA